MTSLAKFAKLRRTSNNNNEVLETSPGITDPIQTLFVGVLTVSDRCARGERNDLSGPNLQQIMIEQTRFRSVVKVYKILPDEKDEIVETLVHWSDDLGLDLIITTGGTGLGPRDVTPEATAAVIERETPGFTIAIITKSLKVTNDAMVTRLKSGIRGKTIIINLPGSKKASAECLKVVIPAIPHALECLKDVRERFCICTANTEFQSLPRSTGRIVEETERVISQIKDNQSDSASQRSVKHHSTLRVPGAEVINITVDELAEATLDVESLLSNNLPTSSSSDSLTTPEKKADESANAMSPETALETVLCYTRVLDTEDVGLIDSLGRILADNIKVGNTVNPISNVSGYAIAGSILEGEVRSINAPGGQDNEVARQIASGSPLPKGANTVVPVKDTRLLDGNKIQAVRSVQSGQGVRYSASKDRQATIKKGSKVGPSEIGLLTTSGFATCKTYKKPVVALLSYGNEEGSNHITLQLSLRQQSVTTIDFGITPENVEKLTISLSEAIAKADILLIASTSEKCRKVARAVLKTKFDAIIHFGSISMSPWSPSYFGTARYENSKKLLFVLPEQPLANILCTLYLLPALRKMEGEDDSKNTIIKAKCRDNQELNEKPVYAQCKVNWRPEEAVPWVESIYIDEQNLTTFDANAIAILPARSDNCPFISSGNVINVILT